MVFNLASNLPDPYIVSVEKLEINSWARRLGWQSAGVTRPYIAEETKQQFEFWLKEKKGPQMGYLERRKKERLDPREYFPPVQSILCFAYYYFPGWSEGEAKVSNYSWGPDYHKLMEAKLNKTMKSLEQKFGEFQYRLCVDTSPVLEKHLAKNSGIGWQGKNTLIMNKDAGSMIFLAEILCDIPYEYFETSEPIQDRCGTCTRCLEACPTDALQPYKLDAQKCISYWNLEHKGDFDETTPPLHSWIAGCDICQEVCPWNQKLIPIHEGVDGEIRDLSFKKAAQPGWREGKAIAYISEKSWQRNLERIRKETYSSG